MSIQIPTKDELKGYYHPMLDTIYVLSNEDWMYHAAVEPEYQHVYKLFVIGFKLERSRDLVQGFDSMSAPCSVGNCR